jgi:hypothetical protein
VARGLCNPAKSLSYCPRARATVRLDYAYSSMPGVGVIALVSAANLPTIRAFPLFAVDTPKTLPKGYAARLTMFFDPCKAHSAGESGAARVIQQVVITA